jgi:subtilase family serine protease
MKRRLGAWLGVSTIGLSAVALGAAPAGAAGSMTPAIGTYAQFQRLGDVTDLGLAPFPCQNTLPAACFGPDQLRAAYGVQPILDSGIDGAGRTIVLIDAFQSPTIQSDLAAFDAIWHLAAPSAFRIIAPDGLTPFDPADGTQIGWSLEISIDVEWAHAMAPGAAIDLVLARSASDVDLLSVTRYAIRHNLGDVISQSFGEAESCTPDHFIQRQHAAFDEAGKRGITLVAASGDQGATQPTCDGSALFAQRTVATPASDPDVTAVGGTYLAADGQTGAYGSESAWQGSGGGFSTQFHRPPYQAQLRTGDGPRGMRGVPDVAYDADPHSGPIVAWSVLAPPGRVGLGVVSGTSVGPPQWAAVVALADQAWKGRLGLVNKALYRVAKGHDGSSAFHDVTSGNNSFGGVTGFSASEGWDAVTGLGTPNAARLIPLLGARKGD